MSDLKTLRREITFLNEVLHNKNVMLGALHYVWCNGGCLGGVDERHGEITEELVLAAEHNTKRLRTWWENKKFQEKWKAMSREERDNWSREVGAKIKDVC